MPLIRGLARATRQVGRAYSSFFSSKPGGGRHVPAKPPKPVLQPGRAKVDNNTTLASGPQAESTATSPPTNTSGVAKAAHSDDSLSSKPTETSRSIHPSVSPPPTNLFSSVEHVPTHPALSSKEYKLHQFFSLHRPLLLLNQPSSTIFEPVDSAAPLFTSLEDQVNNSQHSFSTIDNPPESSPDADADAARQLAHTLVMNRVGGAIAWQQTLSRLGLNDKNDMALAKETAQEWVTIHADSTRRKKRKKMKKHKLKKRRRLTRRQSK